MFFMSLCWFYGTQRYNKMCSPVAFLFIFITYKKVELQVKTHQSETTIANDNNGLVAFLGQVSNKRQSQHFWGNILWTFNTIINA